MWLKPYLEIMDHFGYRTQMKKLNEECFEFLYLFVNYEDIMLFGVGNNGEEELARDFVVEEMGDMLIILTEFIAKYNIKPDELNKHMDYKLARTLERIGSGYYDKEDDLQESQTNGK